MKAFKIQTTNREVYQKFNMLNFNDEIILRNTKLFQVERIVHNINKNNKLLEIEIHPEFILVKKLSDININANLWIKNKF